jgi:hypothetical protein
MQRLVSTLVLFSLTACVSNPARKLTPNAQLIEVYKDVATDQSGGLRVASRGDDELDEEEFYAVVEDKESYDEVHGRRSVAEVLQALGVGTMAVGVGGAIAGLALTLLSAQPEMGTAPIPLDESTRGAMLIPMYVGVPLAVLGGYLLFGYQNQARGVPLVFPLRHAQHALERSLYGEGGLSAANITALELTSEGNGLCSTSGTSLTLDAKDAKGRPVKIDTHDAWFTWATTPELPLTRGSDDDGDATNVGRYLSSPLTSSLAHLDENVTVKVQVTETGLSQTLVLKHDFTCPGTASFSGQGGTNGADGYDGASVFFDKPGSAGKPGKPGDPGGAGPQVTVEAAWVKSPQHGRLALVVVSDGAHSSFALTKGAVVTVRARGGRGGSGGRGGRGGEGGTSTQRCANGTTGGQGGIGGTGGIGGAGGSVTITLADKSLRALVEADVSGGSGGSAGRGGAGGAGGRRGSKVSECKSENGPVGPEGGEGGAGGDGPPGSVTSREAPASQLRLIAQALATNPTLTLEK